ncbi:MAG TPA: hypothetical protein VLX92_00525 [Kofleriaceae bacterium]|nr:hypothetical protein [Kofleriaceae bacterium]
MRWAIVLVVCGAAAAAPAPAPPAIGFGDAAELLFGQDAVPATCRSIECLIEARYAGDARARELALALYRDSGDIAGLGPEEIMDGGYRGQIHLVPQLPVAGYRGHLVWVGAAMKQIDEFFAAQFPSDVAPPSYRWRALAFKFVRSIKKRTPSAYATSWSIEYNVEGSLLTSEAGVTETLFHELFHLNDEDHHGWSSRVLGKDYEDLVEKCGTNPRCLAPYAPNDTMVRGGTYYAFQPNNGDGVHEYAAELAVRYWKEQREMRSAGKLSRPAFKCGPGPNARAWKALVDEFFAGRDLVPACA